MVSGVHPEYFAKQIPDARLHVFPEGKHNIHLKYAAEFNGIVSQFLSEGASEEAGEGRQAVKKTAVNINDIAYGFMGSKVSQACKVQSPCTPSPRTRYGWNKPCHQPYNLTEGVLGACVRACVRACACAVAWVR